MKYIAVILAIMTIFVVTCFVVFYFIDEGTPIVMESI